MLTQISRSKDMTEKQIDLNSIWSELRAGKAKALSKLFCTSYSSLFNYGYRIVPKEAFVEDAIQELFYILWEKRETINEARSVRSYLCTSLRRLIFRRLKKQKNRTKRNHDYKRDLVFEDMHTREELMVRFEINQERKKRLVRAMASLSDREKEAIFLKFYDGLSNTEIARVMNINKQSVYNHVSTAINKMQDIV